MSEQGGKHHDAGRTGQEGPQLPPTAVPPLQSAALPTPTPSPATPLVLAQSQAANDAASSILTPFTKLPVRLARSTVWQVVWNILIFVMIPTALFSYWIVVDTSTPLPEQYRSIRIAIPLAAVWVVSAPLLMFVGEKVGAHWVGLLSADADFGWNADKARRWQERINRLYYPTALSGAVGAVIILAFAGPALDRVAPVPKGWGTAVKFVVMAQAGFTAMSGLHGVFRWVAVTRAATAGIALKWHPFRPSHHRSLAKAYQVSLMLGIFFSTGAFFVPALLAIANGLNPFARLVLWTFIVLLLFGGVVMFVAPMISLIYALSRGKRQFLAKLESPLGNLIDEFIQRPAPKDHDSLSIADAIQRITAIRSSIIETRLFPVGQTIGRALLTVVIPVVSLVLSVLQSGLLTA